MSLPDAGADWFRSRFVFKLHLTFCFAKCAGIVTVNTVIVQNAQFLKNNLGGMMAKKPEKTKKFSLLLWRFMVCFSCEQKMSKLSLGVLPVR